MSGGPGTRLGTYDIVAPLAAGGMGEVFRARDGKLQRDVAIKALPAPFADDPERVARFEREAQALAALHHPNIAGIFDLLEHGGARYLVLELVDGETLAARLARGLVPIDEAIPLARQIADAILRGEPDWTALPADTPPLVRALLQRCLVKDARQRLPHIGVARIELSEPMTADVDSRQVQPTTPPARTRVAWSMTALATAAALALLASGMARRDTPSSRVLQVASITIVQSFSQWLARTTR